MSSKKDLENNVGAERADKCRSEKERLRLAQLYYGSKKLALQSAKDALTLQKRNLSSVEENISREILDKDKAGKIGNAVGSVLGARFKFPGQVVGRSAGKYLAHEIEDIIDVYSGKNDSTLQRKKQEFIDRIDELEKAIYNKFVPEEKEALQFLNDAEDALNFCQMK